MCLLWKILFFKKISTLRIKNYFHFANRLTFFFLLSCPQTEKLTWFCLKLDYPAVLRSRPKGSWSKWKVEKSFPYSALFLVRHLTVYIVFIGYHTAEKCFKESGVKWLILSTVNSRHLAFTESEPASAYVFLDQFSDRNCIVTHKL